MRIDPKNPLLVVLLVAACAVAFYYVASPYQDCLRSGLYKGKCLELTTW